MKNSTEARFSLRAWYEENLYRDALIDLYKRGEWSQVPNPLPNEIPESLEEYEASLAEAGFKCFQHLGDHDIEIRVNKKLNYWLVSIRSHCFLVADFPSLLMLMPALGEWVAAVKLWPQG